MPAKLSTTIGSISSIPNPVNSTLVYDFYQYMESIGTSESYQNVNLKIMIYFSRFLGSTTDFYSIRKKDQILAFLNTRIKDTEIDLGSSLAYLSTFAMSFSSCIPSLSSIQCNFKSDGS